MRRRDEKIVDIKRQQHFCSLQKAFAIKTFFAYAKAFSTLKLTSILLTPGTLDALHYESAVNLSCNILILMKYNLNVTRLLKEL